MTITDKLGEWGPMTVLMIVVAIIAMGVGGAVVIVNPDTLTFQAYLDNMKTFAIAIAGLAGARGILGAGRHVADARVQAAALTPAPVPPAQDIVAPIAAVDPFDEELAFDADDDVDAQDSVDAEEWELDPDIEEDLAMADAVDDEPLPEPVGAVASGERSDW